MSDLLHLVWQSLVPPIWCKWHYFVLFFNIWVMFLYDWLEIKPVNSKRNQPWILTGRTVAEVESLILWSSYVKCWRIGKDLDAGKDWRQIEKGVAEDEVVRQHHQFNGHEFEQDLGVEDGQENLVCCSPWGHKELDRTEWLNWTELNWQTLRSFPVAQW